MSAPVQRPTWRMVVLGAGGHAKVVLEALQAIGGFDVAGLLDAENAGAEVLGVPVLGDDGLLPALRAQGVEAAFVALGANALRDRLGTKLRGYGFALPPAVHPTAQISPSARIDEGAVVMARACVGPLAVIGAMAIINTGAIVEHDNRIGRAAHIAPGVALAGTVTVGDRALVGVGSAVRPGVSIGADAVVGVGSAVVADVAPRAVVAGTPARPLRAIAHSS